MSVTGISIQNIIAPVIKHDIHSKIVTVMDIKIQLIIQQLRIKHSIDIQHINAQIPTKNDKHKNIVTAVLITIPIVTQFQHIPQRHPSGMKHSCIIGTKPHNINIVLISPNPTELIHNIIRGIKLITIHTKETHILTGVVITAHSKQGKAKHTKGIEQHATKVIITCME